MLSKVQPVASTPKVRPRIPRKKFVEFVKFGANFCEDSLLASLRARAEITSHFAAGPQARWRGASDELYPGRYVRSEQQSQRACGPQPRGARRRRAYRLCCRSSTMSDIAFVAAPRICPPGARAKMGTYFCASPKDDPSKVRNYATVYRLCKAHHHRIGVRCCRN